MTFKTKRIIAATVFVIGMLSGCGGSVYVIQPYVQMVEVSVSHADGSAAEGVKVYQCGWADEEDLQSADREEQLRAKRWKSLAGANHETGEDGITTIPLRATQTFHRSIWWMSPCKIDESGVLGRECLLSIDDGHEPEQVRITIQPESAAQGKDYQIEIRSLSKPEPTQMPCK